MENSKSRKTISGFTDILYQGYEKIKIIGKGAYGTAVLCRNLRENKFVVLKEILLMDLSKNERIIAMNEANVLSSLNHQNIIRYYGSFEREGSLLIEMEYADGGNLAQLLNSKDDSDRIDEEDILAIFVQIAAALSYMHEHKILHRDLKTANIFLNKNGTIKVGDFGIAKMMTRSQAQTVIGTPYYLSPEMCEGKDYNEKSDVWALGCILYELTCFRKPFEAPTLPVLVQKIVQCEVVSIPEVYSLELSQLIESILQRDYERRPTAKELCEKIVPEILENLKAVDNFDREEDGPYYRSLIYQFHNFGNETELTPILLPPVEITIFSVSETHGIALTADQQVYVWGQDNFGQLGLGEKATFRKQPIRLSIFTDKRICNVAAGNGFSVFLNEEGLIFTCGDNSNGCLGQEDVNESFKPKLITEILTENISKIACNSKHVLALSIKGAVFSWGCGKDGRLGLGHELNCNVPTLIPVPRHYEIVNIYCGINNSALLTADGTVLVCGDSSHEKLGLPNVARAHVFTEVPIQQAIKDIALGFNHTLLLTNNGKLYGMGRNVEGQLCRSPYREKMEPSEIRDVPEDIMLLECSHTYSVIGTRDNVIYCWGTRYKNNSRSKENLEASLSTENCFNMRSIIKNSKDKFTTEILNHNSATKSWEMFKKPTSILALYANPERVKNGDELILVDIQNVKSELYILVKTNVPPPERKYKHIFAEDGNNLQVPKWMVSNLNSTILLPNTPQPP